MLAYLPPPPAAVAPEVPATPISGTTYQWSELLPMLDPPESKQTLKQRLWERQKKCHYCSRQLRFKTATLDHVTPRAKGGRKRDDNIVLCCVTCNQWKGSRSPEELLKRLLITVDRVRAMVVEFDAEGGVA